MIRQASRESSQKKMEKYDRYNKEFFVMSGFERLRELPKRSRQVMELAKNASKAFTNGDLGIRKQTVSFFASDTLIGTAQQGLRWNLPSGATAFFTAQAKGRSQKCIGPPMVSIENLPIGKLFTIVSSNARPSRTGMDSQSSIRFRYGCWSCSDPDSAPTVFSLSVRWTDVASV